MDGTDREMTLQEWMDRLPKAHQAQRELAEIEADLATSRKIRKYVAFALTGDETADVQLAADGVAARITELETEKRKSRELYAELETVAIDNAGRLRALEIERTELVEALRWLKANGVGPEGNARINALIDKMEDNNE